MIPSTAGRLRAGSVVALLCGVLAMGTTVFWPGSPSSWTVTTAPGSASVSGIGISSGGPMEPPPAGSIAGAFPEALVQVGVRDAGRSDVAVRATVDVYDVEGTSVQALLASLRERGPHDGSGTWAANTAWTFHWSYTPVFDSGCRPGTASVTLDLTYTYPRWIAPPDAAPDIAEVWERYLSRVEVHEQGHREIAETAASELAQALEVLPEQTTCGVLSTVARATVDEVLTRHTQAQVAYDRQTGHGATQGAVLLASP